MTKKLLICGILQIILCTTSLSSAQAKGQSYRSVLHEWTRHGRFYNFDSIEAGLIWDATLLSDEMTSAQQAVLDKRKLDVKVEKPVNSVAFFVGLYTTKDLKEFSLAENSTWKIFLVGQDGTEIPAKKIDIVTLTPTEHVFYPYLNRWAKAYRVEFPVTDLGNDPKLILRSIVAESVLKF